MDDISAKLNEILSDPQSMQQIQNIMGSLGMNQEQNGDSAGAAPGSGGGMPDLSALNSMPDSTGQNQNGNASASGGMPDMAALSSLLGSMGAGQNQDASGGTGGMPDLSALSGLLGSMGGTGQNQNSGGTGGMPDLSALSGLLGSMGGTGQNQNSGGTGGMPDLSALSGLLGSMGTGAGAGPAAPPPPAGGDAINTAQMMATISRIAPMLKKVNEEDDSTRFLRALRPLLGEARRKKLDESIKMMQMMRMLPLLKSSGVLSGILG